MSTYIGVVIDHESTMSTYIGVVIDHEKLFPIEWYPEGAFVCSTHGVREDDSWEFCPQCGNRFTHPSEDEFGGRPAPGRIVPSHPIIEEFFDGEYLELPGHSDRDTAIFDVLVRIEEDEYNYVKDGVHEVEPGVPLMFVVILGEDEEYKHIILGVAVDDLTLGYHLEQARVDEILNKIRNWHTMHFGGLHGPGGIFWEGE